MPVSLPEPDGVTAGDVCAFVGQAGLPANTTIQSRPTGLGFTGSDGPVNVSFAISISPNLTTDTKTLFDVNLQSWNITVGSPTDGSPTDIVRTAGDVLNSIKKGMASAGANMNAAILRKMQALVTEETAGLPRGLVTPAQVSQFVTEEISVTFMTVAFPNNHSWHIYDVRDPTVIFFGDSCIGFGRSLARRELVPANSSRSAVVTPRT